MKEGRVQVARQCTICHRTFATYYQGKDFQCSQHRAHGLPLIHVVKTAIATSHIDGSSSRSPHLMVPIGVQLKHKSK